MFRGFVTLLLVLLLLVGVFVGPTLAQPGPPVALDDPADPQLPEPASAIVWGGLIFAFYYLYGRRKRRV